MVRYAGGKKRICKDIYKKIIEIEEYLEQTDNDYLEPFCGFASVGLQFIEHESINRKIFLCDVNKDIVKFWKGLKRSWKPPTYVDQNLFDTLKYSDSPSADRAYVGNVFSFNGATFSGYRGKYQSKKETDTQIKNNYEDVMDLKPLVKKKNVTILPSRSYIDIEPDDFPNNLTIYCDPPYKTSLSKMNNKHLNSFDTKEFWNTMRKWSENNLVFISENLGHAPKDFKCVWKKEVHRSINNRSRSKG